MNYVYSLASYFGLAFPVGKGDSASMTETRKTLTVNEAAEALGKRPETVRRWIAAGKIESERAGGHVRIPAAALDALKRTCEHCGATYTPERPTRESRFCSAACRSAAAWEKRKAEHPATRGPGRPPKTPEGRKLDLSNKRLADVLKRMQMEG